MHLTILDPQRLDPVMEASLQRICELVDAEIGSLMGVVNLVFCSDERIQELNREYRKQDKVTDVLSFTYYKGKTTDDELLGEVIIDLDQCQRQAPERSGDFEQELYTLCIHGLLHLRGFDHEEDADYRVMKLHEDHIMKALLRSPKS